MPTDKDLKRRVRERMKKTGERYTSARSHVLKKKTAAKAPAPKEKVDLASTAGMSDTAVSKKTGRTWKEWVTVLDRDGAAALSHKEIARHIQEAHEIPGWWAQTVTVGYERIRGLREKGQDCDGEFMVNKSKTFPVPISELWTAFGRRKLWLDEPKLRVTKSTPNKSVRIKWSDGTRVEAYFWEKGAAKSQVQLQHRKLPSPAEAARLRSFWTERLGALGSLLKRS